MLLNNVRISECETYEQKKEVWELFFRMFPNGNHGIENVAEYIEKVCRFARVLIACKDGGLVGFIAFYANDFCTGTAYVTQFLIDEKYRKKGVGRCLLSKCEEECKKNAFGVIKLEVKKDNKNAIAFYGNCGFVVDVEKEKSIYMVKKLEARE